MLWFASLWAFQALKVIAAVLQYLLISNFDEASVIAFLV